MYPAGASVVFDADYCHQTLSNTVECCTAGYTYNIQRCDGGMITEGELCTSTTDISTCLLSEQIAPYTCSVMDDEDLTKESYICNDDGTATWISYGWDGASSHLNTPKA